MPLHSEIKYAKLILGDEKMGTPLTKERFDNVYYPSFEAFASEFNRRIEENNIPYSVYRLPKLALYMLWFGIERDHLIEIKKHHLGTSTIYDPIADRDFKVPQDIMMEIRNLASFKFADHDFIVSDYVIRSRVSGKMTIGALSAAISNFNSAARCTVHNGFQMQAVFESGLFCRVHAMRKTGYQFPIYRKNKRLPEEGYMEYGRLFQRKFTSIKAITAYVNKYRLYIEHFEK